MFERGIGGRPTLVQNVETLAHLALIARNGAAWFRGVGTQDEPGSMLCTVRDHDGRARIVETPIGTPLDRLLRLGEDVQAVLAGGYHGGWLQPATARRVSLSNADLRPAGAIVGPGRSGRPAGRALRAGGDGASSPFPGIGIGRPMRPVLQRPASYRDRAREPWPGRGLPSRSWPTCGAGPACHRARRVPPPGRHRPVRRERAEGFRG